MGGTTREERGEREKHEKQIGQYICDSSPWQREGFTCADCIGCIAPDSKEAGREAKREG